MIDRLRESVNKFVVLCGKAVELNGSLIKEDQQEFQLRLEQGIWIIIVVASLIYLLFLGYHNIKQIITQKFGGQPKLQVSGTLSFGSGNDTAEFSVVPPKTEEMPSPSRGDKKFGTVGKNDGMLWSLSDLNYHYISYFVFVVGLLSKVKNNRGRIALTFKGKAKQVDQITNPETGQAMVIPRKDR